MLNLQVPVDEPYVKIHNNVIDKKVKILFYHAGGDGGGVIWFYPTALQIKTYIDLFYSNLSDHLEWLIPLQIEVSDDELVHIIQHRDVDILCTSHYLWNHSRLTTQLANIKSRLKPDLKIIAGGPSIDVNTNKDFFDQYPFIDYAVYAAGEQAFADIVSHLVLQKPMIAFNSSNCAWKNHRTGQTTVAGYKFVKMIDTSPFVHNARMFGRMVADIKLKKNLTVWLPYSLTRGCPYACTFCDWNSGLGNKVSRRKNTYQQEIDLFEKLGIKHIYLADANVGQYTEDIDMIEYFAEKNIKQNAEFHLSGSFSKLKKENNLKILHTMARGKLMKKTFNLSIQDINPEVLANIDRPDVGWDVHVAMANELREKYPHMIVKAQLIYGLPGQTPETWKNTLDQLIKHNILPMIFLNEPLPASPAVYNPEYQQQFEFEYVQSNRIFSNGIYLSKIPKQSKFFNQQDIVHMNVLSGLYIALSVINFTMQQHQMLPLNIFAIVDDFLQSQHYQTLYNNLHNNWITHNDFFYTEDLSQQPQQIPDFSLGQSLVSDLCFLNYVCGFLSSQNQTEFSVMIKGDQFKKMSLEINSDAD